MIDKHRQSIADACGALLRELDDLLPEAAHIVAAIDNLIVARLADFDEYLANEREMALSFLQRERVLTEAKDEAT
jgi:hypothetical protein